MNRFFLFCLFFIGACAPTTQFPNIDHHMAEEEADIQREIVMQEHYAYFSRLQKVAMPIFTKNAEICPPHKIHPFYGFHAATLDTYEEEQRDAARHVFGLENQPTIFHITQNSPADGLLKDTDIITHIDEEPVKSGRSGLKKMIESLSKKERLDAPTRFTVLRTDQPVHVAVQPLKSCGGKAVIVNDSEVNAYADGEMIYFTRSMMDLAKTDEELALVIGHELAHNTRNHNEAGMGNTLIGMALGLAATVATGVNFTDMGGQIGGAMFSEDFEFEADYVGLYHTARAGYNIDDSPHLWRRFSALDARAIDMSGASHPSNARRFVALERAVQEIKDKKAKNLPLIPEEKPALLDGQKPETNS